MKNVKAITLEAGEILYHQGDSTRCAYIVASGKMVLFHTEDGVREDCEYRGRGAVLGGLSVLTQKPRYASAQALQKTEVLRISADYILADFDRASPLLRACFETSILFSARVKDRADRPIGQIPTTQTAVRGADAIIERYRLEIDILSGIENGEFSMVYQPIVTMDTGTIVGFEALMRWLHPERGQVPPDQFIPVAEDIGVIGKLTGVALTHSCQTLATLQDALLIDYPLFASVNISGHDIARPGFAETMAIILDTNDITPEQIKLEVTETAVIPNNSAVIDNLNAIKLLGCGLSIDDFGTGYSNLAHLKSLPLSTLKIDRCFAGDAYCNTVSGSIVSMLVGLGAALDVDIIAEGVETADDVKALSDLGCHLAQGYYYHRPAPKAELISILASQSDVTLTMRR